MIEVIALDGDDTLWHCEQLFVDTQVEYRKLLAPYVDLNDEELEERLVHVERQNLPTFGYGVKAFTLSLIETAIEVTNGAIPGSELQSILDLGKVLHDHPVQLLDGVADVVDTLTDRYRVMVITKGDLLHQESKLARSGLAELFWQVEIVSEKDEATYRRVLDRWAIDPKGFVMVGNSVRSDVLPPLAIGARAIHVPHAVTWILEEIEPEPDARDFPVLDSLTDLPSCIEQMDR